MKIIIDKNTALPSLKAAAEACDRKPVNPVFSDLKITVKKNRMQVVGTNGETSVTVVIPVTQEHDEDQMTTLVDATMLIDAIKELPEGNIGIDFDLEGRKASVIWGTGKAIIPLLDPKEFPSITAPAKDATSVIVGSEVLQRSLNRTVFATGTDDTRPALTGVLFELEDKALSLVASDAHVLVYNTSLTESDALAEKCSFILHYIPATMLKNLLKGDECGVKITFDKRRAVFTFRNMKVDVLLIDAKYPAYRTIFPKDNDCSLKVNRSLLMSTLRRVTPYADKESGVVVLSLDEKGTAKVRTADATAGKSSTESLSGRYEGRSFDIGLNSELLMDVLSKFSSEEIEIRMKEPSRAAVVSPCGETGYEALVMPQLIA